MARIVNIPYVGWYSEYYSRGVLEVFYVLGTFTALCILG